MNKMTKWFTDEELEYWTKFILAWTNKPIWFYCGHCNKLLKGHIGNHIEICCQSKKER
jgi:hypothetical protein